MRKPIIMMTDTSGNWELVGPKVRADSFFGNTDGLHTVSVKYDNFRGGFKLQGTLSLNPSEEDWFDIVLSHYICKDESSFLEYPKDPFAPTGENGGDTGVDAFTFIGNFTFLRAIMVRRFLGDTPPATPNDIKLYGTIDKVTLVL